MCPYVGVHKRTSLISLSLLLQHCPVHLAHLTLIVCEMRGKWPYNCCFVRCHVQDLLKRACSIPMLFPYSFFSWCFVILKTQKMVLDATSHLWSRLKSQHQSVPGCAEECGDPLVQSGGRWQTLGVAVGLSASPQVQRDPGLASEGVLRLCTLLSQAPFSIATSPRCKGGHYSFPWIAPLYPRYIPYIAEC